jgi:DNA-damage-inducible protein D
VFSADTKPHSKAEDKLRRERILGKNKANLTIAKAEAKVRQIIRELRCTMPEELPTICGQ